MSILLPNLVLFLIMAVALGGIVVAIVGWDRYRSPRPRAATAHPTGEVFIDPETGRRLRVWYDPSTGVREYRDDPPPPGGR